LAINRKWFCTKRGWVFELTSPLRKERKVEKVWFWFDIPKKKIRKKKKKATGSPSEEKKREKMR